VFGHDGFGALVARRAETGSVLVPAPATTAILGRRSTSPATAGTAQADALPAPAPPMTFIAVGENAFVESLGILNFSYSAADPPATASCTAATSTSCSAASA
jgi:hypothetical protein